MEKRIELEQPQLSAEILGVLGGHGRILGKFFGVDILTTSDGLAIQAPQEGQILQAEHVVRRLIELSQGGIDITPQLVQYLAEQKAKGSVSNVESFHPDCVCVTAKGKPILCKTVGQSIYVEAIKKSEITFASGPAGTGKTYLAVAMAVRAFREHQVDRIILTRPAVEAGEKLGFLPGDLQMKVDPYMRPLYDALHDLMGPEQYMKNMEKGLIEVSPLAYMRGRTLDNAFIILDEAQNTTPEQMKMFLTRIGFNSKVVVTGDITQIDLPKDKKSGLLDATEILKNIDGLTIIHLSADDVVRNGIVQAIIRAYEKADQRKQQKDSKKKYVLRTKEHLGKAYTKMRG